MKRTCVVLPMLLIFIAANAVAQNADPSTGQAQPPANTEGLKGIEHLVKSHREWGAQASTPNMTLTLSVAGQANGVVAIRLHTAGVPKEKFYSLVSWPVPAEGPETTLEGVTLNASGLAICSGRNALSCGTAAKLDDPIDVLAQPVPGEPVRLGLVSTDGTVKVFATVVPVPLRGKDHGCILNAVLLTSGAEIVSIEGSGLPPGGELTVTSDSEKEQHVQTKNADAEGRYQMVDLPFVTGLNHGVLKVTVKAATCAPTVKIPWGKR